MPYAGRTNAVHSALKALGCARFLFIAIVLVLGCARIEPPYTIKVIDGDTLDVWTGKKIERIRLIGVDTPETKDPRRKVQRFGKEASTFLRKTIKGKTLRLERTEKDAHKRTLAFVYLPDGRCVNDLIIKEGYGYAFVKYPFPGLERLKAFEAEAREAKRGLWRDFAYERFYAGNLSSRVFHRPKCVYAKRLDQDKRIVFETRQRALELGFVPCGSCRP
jgi:micrococcal nuclease